jgi:hypothetical protein
MGRTGASDGEEDVGGVQVGPAPEGTSPREAPEGTSPRGSTASLQGAASQG